MREYSEGFDTVGFNHAQLDLGNLEQLRSTLGALKFNVLINSAAQTNVDRCETHRDEGKDQSSASEEKRRPSMR